MRVKPVQGRGPASFEQLDAWRSDPASSTIFSPLSPSPCLLFHVGDEGPARAARRVETWLRRVPVPTIAVGPASTPLALIADVSVPDCDAAAALVATIRRTPLAAAVLVKTLRSSEGVSLEAALHIESLAYATLQAGPEFHRWLARYRRRPPLQAVLEPGGPAVLVSRDGNRLRLTLNRPATRNAMTMEMRDALCEALQLALMDDSLEGIVLDARGKCFSVGGAVDEFGTAPDPATAHIVRSLALPGRLLAACARRATVRVHGACIGSGIEFPAFAGRLEASADAWFQLPELKYGLIPGAGGTVSIARRVGRQRVAWLALSGRRIDAGTALAWGLADAVIGAGG